MKYHLPELLLSFLVQPACLSSYHVYHSEGYGADPVLKPMRSSSSLECEQRCIQSRQTLTVLCTLKSTKIIHVAQMQGKRMSLLAVDGSWKR